MENKTIYSIAELNSQARWLLETQLGRIYVLGEISNLARPSSLHLYFTLKDSAAQVRCAFFRMNHHKLDFTPENGQQVLAQATVSLYEGRGDYQLIIHQLQLAGSGALQVAFEKLKKALQTEGLFDDTHKQKIPSMPSCIGVITSAQGAAIHDILHVLKRRSPSTSVIIYPCLVQGETAKTQIVKAIAVANQRRECDILILARGGGSLEDLWPFNEECVARAIFASTLPIVTGIGHEVDFTIADFVADYRAPTPSAAAEYVSADQNELTQQFKYIEQQFMQQINHLLMQRINQLDYLQKRLRHPRDTLREQIQTVDQIEHQLKRQMHYALSTAQAVLATLSGKLDTLSPLATLQRGYAILTDSQQQPIDSVKRIGQQDNLIAQLHDGTVHCTVTAIQQK